MSVTENLELVDVSKSYANLSRSMSNALYGISLIAGVGEFIAVVGESGSGKSTLLKVISDLEQPTSGEIKRPADHKTGFVFQDNTVFPWFTVERNIAYPLEIKGIELAKRHQVATELAELVGLNPDVFLTKYPKELSGGEKRRVAIAMSLAHDAKILLLDEPTSSLDDLNKWHFQDIIQRLWLEKKFTCIMVTHDIEEAIFLGQKVIILKKGALKAVVEVEMPYPRDKTTRMQPEFQSLRKQISDQL